MLLLAFLAVVLSVGWRGAAQWLSHRLPLSADWCSGLLAVLLLSAVFLTGAVAWDWLAEEFVRLWQVIPDAAANLEDRVRGSSWGWLVPKEQQLRQSASAWLTTIPGAFTKSFGILADVALVIVLTVFLALEPCLYRRALMYAIPRAWRRIADELLGQMTIVLRMWLLGRVVTLLVIGTTLSVVLTLLGLPTPVLLGFFTGFCCFIPNVGSILGIIPPLLVALTFGTQTMLTLLGVYCAIQSVESWVLTPAIERRTAEIPPAGLLLVQAVMSVSLGILGLIVASPLAACVLVVIRRYCASEKGEH